MERSKYYSTIAMDAKRKTKERIIAIHQVYNQRDLFRIAMRDNNPTIRLEAVKCITNNRYLTIISKYEDKLHIRIAAVERIKSSKILFKIAKSDKYHFIVRRRAIERQKNQEYLDKLFKSNLDRNLRKYVKYIY